MNIEKTKETVNKHLDSSRLVPWGILVLVTIIFTIILYPSIIITGHPYKLGDIAEKDIKAQRNFFVEDKEATKENRIRVRDEVLTVYDYDPDLSKRLSLNITQAFKDLASVFEEYESKKGKTADEKKKYSASQQKKDVADLHARIMLKKKDFDEKMGIDVSSGAYKILEAEHFSKDIANFIIVILNEILQNGVVANKEILLKELGKGIVLKTIGTDNELVYHNLKKFYGLEQAKTMVRIIGQPLLKGMNYNLRNLIVDITQRIIHPNITLNTNETEKRKKRAEDEVKPVLYRIKTGEMLLREGERVTEFQLLKLKALHAQTKKGHVAARSAGTAMIIISLFLATYVININSKMRDSNTHNKNILFIGCLIIIFLLIFKFSVSLIKTLPTTPPFYIPASSVILAIPFASGAMTICLFLGISTAVPFAFIMSTCIPVIIENRFDFFIYFLINSSMAAYWMQSCRARRVFIRAGAKLGLLNMVLAIALYLYAAEFLWLKLLWDLVFAFMGGIITGILASGIAPFVETVFKYTTDIKLLELANLDQPILRRLMLEAPGTYHHSVIVGSMAEAAASEIDANPLLAKVCGYYHDIGKISNPLYFIENQRDGKNRHDKLAPSMSSLVLIAHIKNGVEMARENGLGQEIIDSIRQHHGTSLIKFFYDKAVSLKGENNVNMNDFRYPGPKPQTREAAIVMLADVVEAASRTLENPTSARIQGHVNKMINNVFADAQLNNCELTLKDLHNIARSFNKILTGIYHHRIEYSDNTVEKNGKGKSGGSDNKQTKQGKDIDRKNSTDGAGHLKRLGAS